MQGKKNYTEKLFLSFQLSDRIPKDNLYRRLRETLDLSFLYKDTKELYGKTGNPSIDPVVFFKLLITGYLENITSDRKLMEHCCMRMDVLYFLGYDLDEELPMAFNDKQDEATLPGTPFCDLVQQGLCPVRRQRDGIRPYPGGGFGPDKGERLHGKRGAENACGLHSQTLEESIGGKRSKQGKTSESRVSPVQISAPEHELKRVEKHHQNLRDSTVRLAGASHKKARLLSNKTHYSPHDPDARISFKPGKARATTIAAWRWIPLKVSSRISKRTLPTEGTAST